MLTLAGVGVTYPGRRGGAGTLGVAGIDLSVPTGQVCALLGPSGCGKSTLLRAVAGLEPLAAGRITLDGVDLARVPVHRRGFGMVFQNAMLLPHRTVAGNIGYGLARQHLPAGVRAERIDELLDLVDLPGFGSRPITALSGGQAHRVALARALAPRPRLLLLDEPLSGLDRLLRDRLLEELRRILRATGTTALFVTHDPEEAFAVADRIAILRAGRLEQIGPPDQLWRSPATEWVAAFVGYSAVIEVADWIAAGGPEPVGLGSGRRLALRPSALVPDPAGELSGTCVELLPAPERSRMLVDIPGLGPVWALAPATPAARETPGARPADPAVPAGRGETGPSVRLRFVPAQAALLDADPKAPTQAVMAP